MNKFSQAFCFALLFIMTHHVLANTSVDVRSEYESWNSGINGNSSALLLGLGGTKSITPELTASAGFMTGEYDSSSEQLEETLNRNDIDLAIGYRFTPNVNLFVGYRLVQIDYSTNLAQQRSFSDLTHGLGIGVDAFQVVYPKTAVYGRLGISGLFSTIDSDQTGTDRGLGFSTGIEGGIVYQIMERTNIGVSLKQQSSTVDYGDNSTNWKSNYVRYGISLGHLF